MKEMKGVMNNLRKREIIFNINIFLVILIITCKIGLEPHCVFLIFMYSYTVLIAESGLI